MLKIGMFSMKIENIKKDLLNFLAAHVGNKEIVDLLISKRVDLNKKDVNGNTAIMHGILKFHINSMIMSFQLLAFNNINLNHFEITTYC